MYTNFVQILKFTKQEVENEKPKTLLGFLEWYIEYLTTQNRIGDRGHFKTVRSVLKKYKVSKDFMLADVTKDWLIDFETYLLSRKNKNTGRPIKKISCFRQS